MIEKHGTCWYGVVILTFSLCLFTVFNVSRYVRFLKKKEIERFNRIETFSDFVYKCTLNTLNLQNDFNLCFVVSLDDCNCVDFHLNIDFIKQIKELGRMKRIKINLCYVVTGKYSDQEKAAFMEKVKKEADVFMDSDNKIREGLKERFGISKTPFLIILNKSGRVKYWQTLEIEEGSTFNAIKNSLLTLIMVIKQA